MGYRAWNAVHTHKIGVGPAWFLQSLNHTFGRLKPGVNVATCQRTEGGYGYLSYHIFAAPTEPKPPHQGAVPDPGCDCGFYVLNDLDAVPFTITKPKLRRHLLVSTDGAAISVVGAVVGWGRVVQHGNEGWRAEKIQVIALLDAKVDKHHLAITRRAAEAYGVPVVGRTALELLAKEYGERLVEVEHGVTEHSFSDSKRA